MIVHVLKVYGIYQYCYSGHISIYVHSIKYVFIALKQCQNVSISGRGAVYSC